jgi:hypothetical protein
MKLPLPTYAGNKFTWTKNHGVTEASDLGQGCGKIPGSRIYDDACDYGFMVIGNHKNLIFSFIGEDRDREGDVTGWKYKSECGQFEILIIND